MSSISIWTDLLDYPDDFAVHKPTGSPWVIALSQSGSSIGYGHKNWLDRRGLISRLMKNECSALLKINHVNYIEKVIYLELA